MLVFSQIAEAATPRLALVIGNSSYEHTTPLPNPPNDARKVASTLRGLGFKVLEGLDLDHQKLRRIIRQFSQELTSAKIAVFYYAGHGLSLNNKNYLVPIDASLKNEGDVDFEAIDLTGDGENFSTRSHRNYCMFCRIKNFFNFQ